MKKGILVRANTVGAFLVFFLFCSFSKQEQVVRVTSPDGQIKVEINSEEGKPYYSVDYGDKNVFAKSALGFVFRDIPEMQNSWRIVNTKKESYNGKWEMPWGEKREVVEHYNEVVISMETVEAPHLKMNLIYKVFDDGLGFRYEFPEQENLKDVYIMDELTEFNLTSDPMVWWIPGDWDINEHLYNTTRFSEINALSKQNNPNLGQTYIPEEAVNTPVTLRTDDGVYMCIHEANLTDFAGMTLADDKDKLLLKSNLVGSLNHKYKVKKVVPFVTPWRAVILAKDAGGLIESNLIVNLNEPNKIGDVSWFKPTKYVGIWWDMHLGNMTWDYDATQDMNSDYVKQWWDRRAENKDKDAELTSREDDKLDIKPKGHHGATTAYAKELIDFAAKNDLHGILVEGWNTGWEHWIGFEDREGVFDFITSYLDYDLEEVVRYGKSKGVELIMHHETSSAPRTYEQQLDTAYNLMESLGIHSVKTGYVGKIIPKGEFHHGQWMVNHYRKTLTEAAKHQIAVNIHEPIKATGIRRTYPNVISREGLRGQEFNAWSKDGGNPPEHLPIIAFTRMLAGPIDYTPGIFNIKLEPFKKDNQVNTTLAQQLALYVVIYSPIQMVPDLMSAYEKHDDAMQFIRDVAVDWEQSKVLNGEIGDYVTIARQERGSENWFVGAITDENARDMEIKLYFLPEGKKYKATLYLDGDNADWDKNPTDYKIEKREVDRNSVLNLHLAPGGGAAISLLIK